jgi:heme/copper-type cytochrome/quinol oxidase subunit 3
MSAHHAPDWVPHREGTGFKHDGTLATWLGLLSYTFFLGVFVAANVYLRGWAPDKFGGQDYANLPEYSTLVLLLAGLLVTLGGSFWKQGSYKAFQAMMILSTLAFTGYTILLMWLLVHTYDLGPAAWTTNIGIYACQIILAAADLIFLAYIGKYFAERNEKKLRTFVPLAMSMFLYTVIVGITVLLVTEMITVGQFAEWCGNRITELLK